MSYNRKALKTATNELGKAKAPAKPKDIITDPMGQWKYPRENTRIPGSDITMQGVDYPVWAQPNVGQPQMMYPGQEYQFPGADYVDEFPQGGNEEYYEDELDEEQIAELRAGGYTVEDISVPQLTQAKKGGSLKKYSRSIEATNKLFHVSPLLKKAKSKKKKIFDPSSNYFDVGGIPNLPLREGRKAYERLGYTDNDRMAVAEEGGFLPQAQYAGQTPFVHPNTGATQVLFQKPAPGKNVKKKSPYQLQEEARIKAGQSRYDMLAGNKPQVSENTKPKYIPKIDKKAEFEKELVQKNIDRQLIAKKIKNSPLYSDEDKAAILMSPQKLDKHSYLLEQQNEPGTIKQVEPQSATSRAWEYMTNPLTAAEYAISGGGAENMPHNINEMRVAGIDPGVVQGRNLVGNALNSSLNLFDAGDKVVKNVGAGNYGTAALEALRFIPASKLAQPLLKYAPNVAKYTPSTVKHFIDKGYAGVGQKTINKLSPLNAIPSYGQKLKGATTPIGNVLESAIDAGNIRMPMDPKKVLLNKLKGKSINNQPLNTAKNIDTSSRDIFSVKFDPTIEGSNIKFSNEALSRPGTSYRNIKKEIFPKYNPERKAKFNVEHLGEEVNQIPLSDPGVNIHRRLPFSNKYALVDPEKLMNNKFQWSTAGTGAQNLLEKYGSNALSSAGLAGVGFAGTSALQGINPIDTYNSINPETGNIIGKDLMNEYKKETSLQNYVSKPDPYFLRTAYDALIKPNIKKKGGVIELDVDDDMINYLISQGYTVENID